MKTDIIALKDWGLPIADIFLSAGPCSAESEEQVMVTARALADTNISFMRAGLWKPRTHPGSFEGVGAEGLKWLQRAREETGLAVGTEVATPEHVEACLEHKIDIVWVGARTTPNPFAVQELADALKGSDIPILIKNPISPDISLWQGAVERMLNAGLKKIGVIHRGFSTSREVIYRYSPNWKIPIEFKRRLPDIPILCDPSHICGNTELIFSVAQEALSLLYDGLMIEVHINPGEALSDAKQQLTPDEFLALINRLTIKTELTDSEQFDARMKELRVHVDGLDEHLIKILGKRMEIVRQIGALKRKNNISTLQPRRWQEIVASRIAEGTGYLLSEEFIFQLFESIHEEAIRQQESGK
ncbi:chorismate mutase [Thermodesulfobacteriota bacterium]